MFSPSSLVLSLFALPATLPGAASAGPVRFDAVQDGLDAFREAHGPAWSLHVDPGHGYGRFLSGGRRPAEFPPTSDAEWIQLALLRVQELFPLFALDPIDLLPIEVRLIELASAGTSDKVAVRLRQEIEGIPVVGGTVVALFLPGGDLVALDSQAIPASPSGFLPRRAAFEALPEAYERYRETLGLEAVMSEEPELVIWPHRPDGVLQARLAWSTVLHEASPVPGQTGGRGMRIVVAADRPEGGVLYEAETTRHQSQGASLVSGSVSPAIPSGAPGSGLSGTVLTRATFGPDGQNPRLTFAQPDAEVRPIPGAYTNVNGGFAIPGAPGPTDLTLGYRGLWADITNLSPSGNHEITQTFVPGSPATLTLNPLGISTMDAQANVYLGLDRFHAFIKATDPNETRMDFPLAAQVNANNCAGVGSPCYHPTGGPGGTPILVFLTITILEDSTAGTIVSHEAGHWANDVFDNGFPLNDAFDEAVADTWAMYVWDTSELGVNSGLGSRSGTNLEQFCGDGNTDGCVDTTPPFDEHQDGLPLMGALWKVRENLNASLGDAAGDAVADHLFLSWLQVYDDLDLAEIVKLHWLALDDDNGDLSDGTPHLAQIDAGFVANGWTGIVLGNQDAVLHPPSPGPGERFGNSVAIDGSTLVVGEHNSVENGTHHGAVSIYVDDGSSWVRQATLVPPPPFEFQELFGDSVAISGDWLVVGAHNRDTAVVDSGAAFVYRRTGSTWNLHQTLAPWQASSNMKFGLHVAIAANTIAVGAQNDDQMGANAGAVYTFRWNGSTWAQGQKLFSTDPEPSGFFGWSVALNGTTLAAGEVTDHDVATGLGSVQTFVLQGNAFVFEDKLSQTSTSGTYYFGESIALDGNRMLIGATPLNPQPADGAVFYFTRGGSNWTQQAKLLAHDSNQDVGFGRAVAIDGTRAVIGAPGSGGAASAFGGRAEYWELNGTQWAWDDTLITWNAGSDDGAGSAVAIDGGTVVVGVPGRDDGAGVASVFTP